MASQSLSAVLALEISSRQTAAASGNSRVDCADGTREPDVGPGTSCGRALAEVGHFRVTSHRAKILALAVERWSRDSSLFPALGNLCTQSRPCGCCLRFHGRDYGPLPVPLRVVDLGSGITTDIAVRCNRTSHGPMDSAAIPRGVAGGEHLALCDPRSRCGLFRRSR